MDADSPPLRLALGGDAVDAIPDRLARTDNELRAWETLSRAAGF